MKYKTLFAYNIPCYADIEIDADTPEEAVETAKRMLNNWDNTPIAHEHFEPAWDAADGHRVVFVQDDNGTFVSDGFAFEEKS